MKNCFFVLVLLLTIINPTFAFTSNDILQNDIKMLGASEKNNIDIFQNIAPAIVNVSNVRKIRGFFEMYADEVPQGSGSGYVWGKDGHIVTNYHVVASGSKIYISFQNDTKKYEAEVVGVEPQKDIAVLKLKNKPKNPVPIPVGTSRDLKVGQKAIAIGNPFGLDHTMTVGIISALGRKIKGIGGVNIHDMIQTDASINPGNSGGPLLNSRGQIIGMNTMIYSSSGASAGVGFAVPIDTIKRIVPQIIKHGKVKRIGLGIAFLSGQYERYFDADGLIIASVAKGGPADKAGLQGVQQDEYGRVYLGDMITAINGKKVETYEEVFDILYNFKEGDSVTVEYKRGNKKRKVKIKLDTYKFEDR